MPVNTIPMGNMIIKRLNKNPDCKVEQRSIEGQSPQNILEGYAIVFNQRTAIGTYFYEEIDPHALDGADMDLVFLFRNHNELDIPMAAYRKADSLNTMALNVDDKGLHFEASLDIEGNPDSSACYSAVKRHDVRDMSFCFCAEVETDEWSDINAPMPIRRITKISKVTEISVVNEGAYPTTEVYARSNKVTSFDEVLKRGITKSNLPLRKKKFKFKEEKNNG